MRDLSGKKVMILYTGGTIGMKKTPRGYAPVSDGLSEKIRAIDDLSLAGMPTWDFVSFSPLLDSADVAVDQWNRIAGEIAAHYDDYDGFVVLHGTDTMAYTASALSFMLEGLGKPVILTGAQIPLSEVRSDGRDNVIASVMIAAEGVANEVCLFFGGKLLRGNRATKMSADRLVAFDSPNYPILARADIAIQYHTRNLRCDRRKKPIFHPFSRIPIAVWKIFPGIQFDLFTPMIGQTLSGVILETFGTGNVPGVDGELLPLIKSAFRAGTVVTVCSQCPTGGVLLGAYQSGDALKKAGAVSGLDMTTEAAVTKLYALFSRGYTPAQVKERMGKNMAGELTAQKAVLP